MSKDDSILFGAKRAGITWLFKFDCAERLKRARAGAARLGMSLAELLCSTRISADGVPELPEPRKFTDEDRKANTIKIQITECDPFMRKCLERQAALWECESAEEYIIDCLYQTLLNDEENAILDPQTGDAVLINLDLGSFAGCHVDKGAKNAPPPSNFTRRPIPRGTIVEQFA
jgi:hypothetical protein